MVFIVTQSEKFSVISVYRTLRTWQAHPENIGSCMRPLLLEWASAESRKWNTRGRDDRFSVITKSPTLSLKVTAGGGSSSSKRKSLSRKKQLSCDSRLETKTYALHSCVRAHSFAHWISVKAEDIFNKPARDENQLLTSQSLQTSFPWAWTTFAAKNWVALIPSQWQPWSQLKSKKDRQQRCAPRSH